MADEPMTSTQTQPAPRTVADRQDGNGHRTEGHAQGAPDNKKYAAAPPPDEKSEQVSEKPAADPRKRAIGLVIGAIVLIGVLTWGVNYYHYSQTHVSTDDAYVTGNLVNISPLISGTLNKLTVDEGDSVSQGQLIAQLDDSGPAASLRQAQASYDAAESQIPQAELNLAFQKQTTQAAIQKAQAGVASQAAKTQGSQQQVILNAATTKNQISQAQSQVAQAEAQVRVAAASLQTYRQAVQTAQRAADAAAANVRAAQANATKATRDEARYAGLVKQEAVTPQQYDTALAAAQTAQAQLSMAQQQTAQAKSQVAGAQSNVNQAQYQLAAARQQVDVARAGLGIALANQTQVGISQTNVLNNMQQGGEASADLANAFAGRQQIALREKEIATYQAQAMQAKAALANAQVQEDDTRIYSPSSGQVVKKAVNVGTALSPGQTILTMTAGNDVWVTANFKETQLRDVRAGQKAEVEVDAFPGKIFKGHVASLNEATGASIALLPPDNATGNFTKVVQRVPVKIVLDPAGDSDDKTYATKDDISRLSQGESVTATIETKTIETK